MQNPFSISYPWLADQGDGTYRNPILCADYSDPDAIRVGNDFYMTASSFNCAPGLPILHSRDLVNWTLINHAIPGNPGERFNEVQAGQGVWAPAIRHHAGKFWIFFPMPDEGIFVTTAEDPAGRWSEPHLLLAGKGLIDPCPLWDDDGQAYLVHAFAGSRAGINSMLRVLKMAPDASCVLDQGEIVFNEPIRHPTLEGPKVDKINGWYYFSAPAGGVQQGWQLILRSKNIYGPYEEKIVLAQRGTPVNGPHQGALVDTPQGEWWFLHFQDMDMYGRVLHMQPVRWEDGWPLIGVDQDENGVGKPALQFRKPALPPQPAAVPATSDEFDGEKLGLQWQWYANPSEEWASLSARPGHLRLFPRFTVRCDFSKAANLLLQKLPAREFSVETKLEIPEGGTNIRAGLIMMGREWGALDAQRTASGYRLRLMSKIEPFFECEVNSDTLRLKVQVFDGGICYFGVVEDDGAFHHVGPAVAVRAGTWIGAKVGVYCITPDTLDMSGHADFDYFRFS